MSYYFSSELCRSVLFFKSFMLKSLWIDWNCLFVQILFDGLMVVFMKNAQISVII